MKTRSSFSFKRAPLLLKADPSLSPSIQFWPSIHLAREPDRKDPPSERWSCSEYSSVIFYQYMTQAILPTLEQVIGEVETACFQDLIFLLAIDSQQQFPIIAIK